MNLTDAEIRGAQFIDDFKKSPSDKQLALMLVMSIFAKEEAFERTRQYYSRTKFVKEGCSSATSTQN